MVVLRNGCLKLPSLLVVHKQSVFNSLAVVFACRKNSKEKEWMCHIVAELYGPLFDPGLESSQSLRKSQPIPRLGQSYT